MNHLLRPTVIAPLHTMLSFIYRGCGGITYVCVCAVIRIGDWH